MEIEFPKETEKLGRIAAQTAKQVIAQRVREAEREKVYAEFSERVGEVVNATVKRFESGDIIAEIGRVEAQIPRKEQSRAENYAIGDRVRAVIKAVTKNAKGPQVILSRTDPALLVKLFEQEVPEIYDGTVIIRGAVREAGDRAKVAVDSRERDVDPVGACVGMRGTRVQAIIRELRGEKIDIVEWSDDPVQFVTKALSPARVQRVSIVDDETACDGSRRRRPTVVARDRQEGPERPSGRQAERVEDRHQERGGQAPGSRGATGGHRVRHAVGERRRRWRCPRFTTRSWRRCATPATTRSTRYSRPAPTCWRNCPGSTQKRLRPCWPQPRSKRHAWMQAAAERAEAEAAAAEAEPPAEQTAAAEDQAPEPAADAAPEPTEEQ